MQVKAAWKLTPTELVVLWRVWLGDKHEAIGHWLGQHPADDRPRPAAWGVDRTRHAVDAHWRSIKRKLGQPTHVLVIRAVDDLLADLRQKAAVAEAVEKAVAEAVEPLARTIAELQQQVNAANALSSGQAPDVPGDVVHRKERR